MGGNEMTDAEEIQNTIAEYCHFYDDRRFDEFEDLWAEDAIFHSSTRDPVHRGRHNIRVHIEGNGARSKRGIHGTFNPVIKVTGDTAEATTDYIWAGVSEERLQLGPGGRYNFRFVKNPDRWRIAELYVKVLLTAEENATRRARGGRPAKP